MSILIDANTKCVVFGAERAAIGGYGAAAPFFASSIVARCDATGAVATRHWLFDSVPAFKSAGEARQATGASVAAILSPADEAGEQILACIESGYGLVIVMTEELSVEHRERIKLALHRSQTKVIGPGSGGVVSPGCSHVGNLPHHFHRRGVVGIVSRSTELSRDVALQTTALGLGQSTVVDLGSQPVSEASLIDSLCALMADPETLGIALVGTGDGRLEEEAATCLRALGPIKPVVAYIDGLEESADPYGDEADRVRQLSEVVLERKVAALRQAGVVLVQSPQQIGQVLFNLVEARQQRAAGAPGASDFAAAMRLVEQHVYDVC